MTMPDRATMAAARPKCPVVDAGRCGLPMQTRVGKEGKIAWRCPTHGLLGSETEKVAAA